jgi:hypothetical protein
MGLPLAIELATARLRSLSLSDLYDRLDQRFGLLTGGSRTALPRQRTLRATVDWSYSLLNSAEQVLLRRLPVFADSFRADPELFTTALAVAAGAARFVDTAAALRLGEQAVTLARQLGDGRLLIESLALSAPFATWPACRSEDWPLRRRPFSAPGSSAMTSCSARA